MTTGTTPLRLIPPPPAVLSIDQAGTGLPVSPITRLRMMSSSEWEDFVLEWAHSLKRMYSRTEKCAGSGDMGRDIVAFEALSADDPWDNYQCKHYDRRLAPADVWLELGKLVYYTFKKEFTVPRSYVFVAPQGVGIELSKLLRSPDKLRARLLAAWPTHCEREITKTTSVPLDAPILKHIDGIDFGIFSAASPLAIIEQHRTTQWHAYRFGGGLPPRGPVLDPPADIEAHETTYVRALLDAYEDRLRVALANIGSLSDAHLGSHFSRSRREFYSAESLREFSKDNVPPGTFESLLQEVHDGVVDVVERSHPDSYERVLATVAQAKNLQLTANALVTRTTTTDRGGMCHQLANDRRLQWRRR